MLFRSQFLQSRISICISLPSLAGKYLKIMVFDISFLLLSMTSGSVLGAGLQASKHVMTCEASCRIAISIENTTSSAFVIDEFMRFSVIYL